jgi:acyl carrier protein
MPAKKPKLLIIRKRGCFAMSMRTTILDEIRAVAADQEQTLAPLTDESPLLETGLDSLGFAILVSRLEDATGLDPFANASAARFPRTIGDLIAFYEEALV